MKFAAVSLCLRELIRGDATDTAGTATAVPNISQISSGLERVFYFVGHANNFVGFQSYIFCLNSSSDKEYGLETRRDYSRDRRARYYYQGIFLAIMKEQFMMCEIDFCRYSRRRLSVNIITTRTNKITEMLIAINRICSSKEGFLQAF